MNYVPPLSVSETYIRNMFLREGINPDLVDPRELAQVHTDFNRMLWGMLGTVAHRARHGFYGDEKRLLILDETGFAEMWVAELRHRQALTALNGPQQQELAELAEEVRRWMREGGGEVACFATGHPIARLVSEGGSVVALLNPKPPEPEHPPDWVKATVVE